MGTPLAVSFSPGLWLSALMGKMLWVEKSVPSQRRNVMYTGIVKSEIWNGYG
jgi:hypothetical protein